MRIPETHWGYCQREPAMQGLIELVESYAGDMKMAKQFEAAMGERFGTVLNLSIATSFWLRSGKPHFILSPAIQRAFDQTHLKRVPVERLLMPFRCIYISFPETAVHIWNNESGRHVLTGAYLSSVKELEEGKSGDLLLCLWGRPGSNRRGADDAIFNVQIHLDQVSEDMDFEAYFTKYLSTTDWKNDLTLSEVRGQELPPSVPAEGQRINTQACLWAVRQAINLLLYLQTPNPDVEVRDPRPAYDEAIKQASRKKNPTKREKALAAAQKLPRDTVTIIGGSYTAPRLRSSGSRGDGTLSVRPHWRRGHFHRYWIGPKLSEAGESQPGTSQVTKWVEPVWVGAEEPETTRTQTYYVVP